MSTKRIKIGKCELCKRDPIDLTFHHLIPRTFHANSWFKKNFTSEQMQEGINICTLCHSGIHQLIDEKVLGREYNTIEKLMTHEGVKKHVEWASKRKF
jgi:hypothetical protein